MFETQLTTFWHAYHYDARTMALSLGSLHLFPVEILNVILNYSQDVKAKDFLAWCYSTTSEIRTLGIEAEEKGMLYAFAANHAKRKYADLYNRSMVLYDQPSRYSKTRYVTLLHAASEQRQKWSSLQQHSRDHRGFATYSYELLGRAIDLTRAVNSDPKDFYMFALEDEVKRCLSNLGGGLADYVYEYDQELISIQQASIEAQHRCCHAVKDLDLHPSYTEAK